MKRLEIKDYDVPQYIVEQEFDQVGSETRANIIDQLFKDHRLSLEQKQMFIDYSDKNKQPHLGLLFMACFYGENIERVIYTRD